jgi:transcriptional regulator with XRE-family HTH domain
MSNDTHWTERSVEDFVHRITFDFTTQIDKALEASNSSQADLAKNLGVSEGRVSQVLNNPRNLSLNSVVRCARAIGRKVTLVLYDDGDSANKNGPVNSEIFSTCWERCGRPADFFALRSESTGSAIEAPLTPPGTYYLTSGQYLSIGPGTSMVPYNVIFYQYKDLQATATRSEQRLLEPVVQ